MPRYRLFIEYLGTNYHGWQRQPNAITVQEKIEEVLRQVMQQEITIFGQGRTDSGVHALAQTAHFDAESALDLDSLKYALLGLLPSDIAVWEIDQVSDEFHARFDATSRSYRYQIITRPSPHLVANHTLVTRPLDLEAMRQCANLVEGRHDFRALAQEEESKTCICEVSESRWEQQEYRLTYTVTANRFLRHLVRRLVGTMLEVGRGKLTVVEFESLLTDPDSSVRPHKAAAKGLTLLQVAYPE